MGISQVTQIICFSDILLLPMPCQISAKHLNFWVLPLGNIGMRSLSNILDKCGGDLS